jgi:16S rRNA (uracil1498-N3)-methyltransferase
MVLPLFLHPLQPLPGIGQEIILDGPEGKHAVGVRRLRVGEGIQLSNGLGTRVLGQVSAIAANQLSLSVVEVILEAPPVPGITLIQALAKGDRDELAVQAGTELGISSVIPWQAERCISRWDGPKIAKGVARWQLIANEASKQALRSINPSVTDPVSTKQLAAQIASFALVLVLDPTAESRINQIQLPDSGQIAVVVGPEGGIDDSELALLRNAGAVRVRLGDSILRTSTAGLAAIAVLEARLGRW